MPSTTAGKAVFVEKPLALTEEQVLQVLATVEETGNDRLMVGFNRRFAPLFTYLRDTFRRNDAPVSARYLVNAGQLDPTSWYLKTDTEGSRFAGEGGHFVDTLTALVGHDPVAAVGQAGPTATSRCRSATRTDRWARSPMRPEDTVGSRRRRSTSPAAAPTPASTTSTE